MPYVCNRTRSIADPLTLIHQAEAAAATGHDRPVAPINRDTHLAGADLHTSSTHRSSLEPLASAVNVQPPV